jgi:ATP-binding cassette subfamily A (ABC1) protein 3
MSLKQQESLLDIVHKKMLFFEGMSVREHLQFYAKIKGIIKNKRASIIEDLMKQMDLTEFAKVQVQKLSGGNKRKLSVAIAMIGNPPIVFLDEPSTGMDPRAKRFMWTIISRISTLRKKSTVILTTHSMEEAEALCTKMGIMVNGRFKCYGTSQDIKDKFGTGFEIEIKIQWPTEEEAINLASTNNIDSNIQVTQNNVDELLKLVKMENLVNVEAFEQIETDIEKDGSVSLVALFQWALLENAGLIVKQALEENTPQCRILEHYNNFFKFRIDRGNKTIGFFFGFMEKTKAKSSF